MEKDYRRDQAFYRHGEIESPFQSLELLHEISVIDSLKVSLELNNILPSHNGATTFFSILLCSRINNEAKVLMAGISGTVENVNMKIIL